MTTKQKEAVQAYKVKAAKTQHTKELKLANALASLLTGGKAA